MNMPVPNIGRTGNKHTLPKNAELRSRLADLLAEAAEIEQDVLCQYLFAIFSLKTHPDEGGVTWQQLEMMRRWKASLMVVARQEMEHLGLVSNLLTAIGEAPNLKRPNFPIPARSYPMRLPSKLERFSPDTLLRFVCFEMPRKVGKRNYEFLEKHISDFHPSHYDGIARTYDEIRKLFDDIDPDFLFVGPSSAQFITTDNIPVAARGMSFPQQHGARSSWYDLSLVAVTNRESADGVIDQILEEGEGTDDDDANCHFTRFLTIYREYQNELAHDTHFEPARPVVENPHTRGDDDSTRGGSLITHPATRRAMELFDHAYGTMMLMLMRFFAHTDENAEQLVGLQNVVFFPMMTTVIRPLGEILTRLPAHDGASETAGPSFVLARRIELIPHRRAAWHLLLSELQLMMHEAEELRDLDAFPEKIRERLSLIYENIGRLAMWFQDSEHVREG